MARRSKQPTPAVALTYNRQRRDNEALWTRIQGHSGIYQVQRATEDTHRVELKVAAQPVCDCETYRLWEAHSRPGKGAACPHIEALRDCGFLAA